MFFSMLDNFLRRAKTILLLQNVRFLYLFPFFTRRVSRCPVCDGPGAQESENRYTALDKCAECGHVYSRVQPRERILNQMYKDAEFWYKDKAHQGIHDVTYGDHWKDFLAARTAIIERTGIIPDDRPHKIFEIGCSEGILLKELDGRGHDAVGCEMNPETSRMGVRANQVKIYNCPFEECVTDNGAYDAVLSFHTLEHLCDLRGTLEKIAGMLSTEGAMLVEVPTGPEEYHNTYHLHFFSPESLKALIERHFEEAEILENEFVDPWGTKIVSLYGVGRRPRRFAASQS